MTLKSYLVVMTVTTLVLIGVLSAFIAHIDPFMADTFIMALFYVLFFLACTGVFSVIGFFIRLLRKRSEAVFRHVRITVRQGAFFAAILTAVLVLQRFRILNYLHIALLIVFFTTIEVFFRTAPARTPSRTVRF